MGYKVIIILTAESDRWTLELVNRSEFAVKWYMVYLAKRVIIIPSPYINHLAYILLQTWKCKIIKSPKLSLTTVYIIQHMITTLFFNVHNVTLKQLVNRRRFHIFSKWMKNESMLRTIYRLWQPWRGNECPCSADRWSKSPCTWIHLAWSCNKCEWR